MKRMRRSVHGTLLLGIVLPALAYLLLRTLFLAPPPSTFERLGIDPRSIDPDTLAPKVAAELGLVSRLRTAEHVIVVMSSSSCPASATEGFDDAVRRIRRMVRDQLAERPEAVQRMVGVALDQDPRLGAEYLATLADFDEIVSGGRWLNTATEKYLWGPLALPGITPQVIVMERSIRYADDTGAPVVEGEHVVRTISGADEIIGWVAEGAPLAVRQRD